MRRPLLNGTRRQALREMREAARLFWRGLRHPDNLFIIGVLAVLLLGVSMAVLDAKDRPADPPEDHLKSTMLY